MLHSHYGVARPQAAIALFRPNSMCCPVWSWGKYGGKQAAAFKLRVIVDKVDSQA